MDARLILAISCFWAAPALAQGFDPAHKAWDTLVRKHVVLLPGSHGSQVRYAVNCASIGCPMLREEAYVAGRLEQQLDEQALRFLSDRTRNRFRNGKLEVSKIFDWFKEDFEPRQAYFARYAKALDYPGGAVPLEFLDYDWTLNEFRSSSPR